MKSQLLTALSVVGVLGTATTAMAANTDTLALQASPDLNSATEVLLPATTTTIAPTADPTATPTPTETMPPTAEPAPAPVVQAPTTQLGTTVQNPEPAPVVNATTGGSGSRVEPVSNSVPVSYDDHDDDDHDEEHDDDHHDGDDHDD